MRYRYTDESPVPASLFVPVVVHFPEHPELSIALRGKVDTAADMSCFPSSLTRRREVVYFGERYIRQIGMSVRSYLVEIELEGRRFSVEAVVHDRQYVILGRDILNQLKLVADGPDEVFSISW